MAIRKIKNKVQNSRAALQAHCRKVVELRAAYRKALGEITAEMQELDAAQDAAEAAEQQHKAAAKALDAERERLDGVFAARLQQARNEIAQLTGQVATLTVRCRRLEVDKVSAEFSEDRVKEKARTISYCAYALGALAIAQDAYYTQWYVPVVEFIKGLL